jgi:hypothetical protein
MVFLVIFPFWCRNLRNPILMALFAISSSDARPLHDGETHPKWKFQAPQAVCLNRAVAEWIIRDTLHPAAIDGAGFTDLMKIAEPRYVLPSAQYFKTVFLDFLL